MLVKGLIETNLTLKEQNTIKETRKLLLATTKVKHYVKSGDKRLKSGMRICAICHRQLSSTSVVTRKTQDGRYYRVEETKATYPHIVIEIPMLGTNVCICKYSSSCYTNYERSLLYGND